MENIKCIVPVRLGSEHSIDRASFPTDTIFVSDEGKGKKYALYKGVQQCTADYLWFRDADTKSKITNLNQLSKDVLNRISAVDMLILPLAIRNVHSLFEHLQQLEYLALQSLTIYMAQKGRAVMCSGANMIVRRAEWLNSYKDLHLDIPSGDDMFLLESFKKRNLMIGVCYDKQLVAEIEPEQNLSTFLRQRMRWAGKAPNYKDKDIVLCGVVVLVSNLLAWLPPVFIIKYIIDMRLCHLGISRYRLRENDLCINDFLVGLLLEIVYPIYMLICLLGGLLRKSAW